MSISPPTKISVPFGTGGLKNVIPASADPVTGNAGYNGGFPAINMTPKVAGGIPPFGEDFNGIFFEITTAIQFLEAGGSFPYDSTYATAVGGYPLGALVSRTDNAGLWRNTVANNTTDPEAFGAGWQPEDAGSTAIVMTNANVTLTALQSAKSIITITGVLTANLNLIFPTYKKQWVVVNNCTGAFSITCKTAAGSGIAIAAGSLAPVYGDGTNISLSARQSGNITSTTNSSLVIPAGVTSIRVSACSGGGGGGGGGGSTTGTNVGSGGGGGGAGQAIQDVIYTVTPLSTISWTIGTAGVKGIGVSGAAGTNGGNGGNTVITGIPSGTITLTGGSGGTGGASAVTPAGSIGGNGFPRGGSGQDSTANNASGNGAFGGSSPFGSGGSNGRGGIAGAPSSVNNGSDADGYGGGGGSAGGVYTGASTAKGGDGGNGTPGFIKIEWN